MSADGNDEMHNFVNLFMRQMTVINIGHLDLFVRFKKIDHDLSF